jgi:pimeloyl-ACP methyl ester carboxylesterase
VHRPELQQWHALGSVAVVGAQRIFRVDSAVGDVDRPVLLLIHGFPTASWDFARIWQPLAAQFRLVACDLLGFGFSSKPRRHDYAIAEQADIVEAVAAQHDVVECHVLAHDYGATVAQELLARDNARRHPRLRSVCLLNGGLFPETHRPRRIQNLLRGPLGPFLAPLVGRRRFGRSLAAVFGAGTQPDRDDLDAFWQLFTRDGGRRIAHRLLRYIDERVENRERWVGALQQARCPLLLVNGSDDPVSGAHMVARYRELVGEGSGIVELPGIGHYPQIEAPGRVVEELVRFIRASTGAPQENR